MSLGTSRVECKEKAEPRKQREATGSILGCFSPSPSLPHSQDKKKVRSSEFRIQFQSSASKMPMVTLGLPLRHQAQSVTTDNDRNGGSYHSDCVRRHNSSPLSQNSVRKPPSIPKVSLIQATLECPELHVQLHKQTQEQFSNPDTDRFRWHSSGRKTEHSLMRKPRSGPSR